MVLKISTKKEIASKEKIFVVSRIPKNTSYFKMSVFRLLPKPECKKTCFRGRFKSSYIRRSLCHEAIFNPKASAGVGFKVETILDQKKHQPVIDFIQDNSYPRSSERMPLAIGHGALTSLVEQLPDFLYEGVSLIATDPRQDSENQVVGVAINHILNPSQSFDRASPDVGVKAFRTCLQQIQASNNVFETKKVNLGMNILYIGVKERFEGHGLGQNLAENSIRLARQLKMDFVQSVVFSDKAFNILKRLEFEELKSLKLFDYKIDRAQAFPIAGTDDVVRFLFKHLSHN